MEYEAIQNFFMVLVGICGSIITIAGMVAVVIKAWKWAHRDTDSNTDRLDEHDTYLASDKRRIEELERQQEEMKIMNKMQLRALFALLGHEIDGNHTTQLKEMRDEINTYLIEK